MNLRRLLCLSSLLLLTGCAWVRRENRPVWTAFEDHLVPESRTTFTVALPVTVPLGVLAILVDTLVAHPLQVVDDAADDAADLWRGIDLEKAYYSEAGMLPVRAIGTPVWFLGAFLGRSMFDVPGPDRAEEERRERLTRSQRNMHAWLRRIAAGSEDTAPVAIPTEVDEPLRAALALALQKGTALGRMRVYEVGWRSAALVPHVDWIAGLRDPSAVVRHCALRNVPAAIAVPEDLIAQLRADPDEAVRLVATRFRKK